MRKILLSLTLIGVLVFPMLALAQGTSILEKCKLRHNLGERLCKDLVPDAVDPATRLKKGCTVKIEKEADDPDVMPEDRTGCERECATEEVPDILVKETGVICLIDFINTISDWIFAIFLVIAIIFLILAGIQFVTAGGSPEKVTEARTKIIYAIVGLAVAFVARGLVNIIEALVG